MRLRRTTGFFVLFLMSAFILSACGGGGGGSSAPAPLAPTTITSTVYSAFLDNALINGSVNPNGLAVTAWFEYGTDASLSTFTKTGDIAVAAGTVPQSINATLLGLTAGTKYYYRVAASSTAGASKGTIENLTTSSLPPVTITTQASSITLNSAVLNGSVNPNGLATTAWFEHGTDASLTTFTKTGDQAIGSGKTSVLITQSISGLTASTTYYFRAVASSSAGTTAGNITSLVTSANPAPVANAGTDQSVLMGNSVTLDGSGSSDGGNAGTITYQWTRVGSGTPVTLTGSTTANPTFIAPTVSYPSEVLTFQVTVTSTRGPSATDNVNVTSRWGSLDDFSTDTTGSYALELTGPAGDFSYDSAGKRAKVTLANDNMLAFALNLPITSNQGAFSLDFLPTVKYPTGGGIRIRLMQNDNNTCYEIANFDWDIPQAPGHTPSSVRKIVGGSVVQEVPFVNSYAQGAPQHISITFSPTLTTVVAFGETISLGTNGTSITVNKFEVWTGQQDAYYDNILLEAKP